MNLSNVRWIFLREVRDQLRDRRTLFTIAVMPLLLYPLLGASFLQVAQFMREHPTRILVLGRENLPESPALIVEGAFAPEVCDAHERELLQLTLESAETYSTPSEVTERAKEVVDAGRFDAVVYFPPDFAGKLTELQQELNERRENGGGEKILDEALLAGRIPQPVLFRNLAVDKSRIAFLRLDSVLDQWRRLIVKDNLRESRIPEAATQPFQVELKDVAEPTRMKAAVWSKILPFVLLVWALTGAFYPAIDLCAGEKERGTLETLLSSPAMRSEIVWGKLLTVMTFSMATALLNLLGMGITGMFIVTQLSGMPNFAGSSLLGPPPLLSTLWLIAALPPMSALFSALSLAIASFARSSKEGQYYLMPLLMVILPLMTLPMLPASQLDLGTSLIPVAGLMLLMRWLMEGRIMEALPYVIPVAAVTTACCLFAIRWAIDQFNKESVLFRESERWELGLWMRHLVRDREDMPSFAEAMFCAVLLLVVRFFAGMSVASPNNWNEFQTVMLITQLAFFATPPVLMAIILTRRPDKALSFRAPSFLVTVPIAALLAVLLHPLMMSFARLVMTLYPLSSQTAEQFEPLTRMIHDAPLWKVLLLMAVVPAVCEETAFRGFILSGFRRIGHKWTAIALASIFFGLAHGILQQSITASAVGMILGYLTVKTGSLLPAIAYHAVHNSLGLMTQRLGASWLEQEPLLEMVFVRDAVAGGVYYSPTFTIVAGLAGAAILFWYKSLPYTATREETLQKALDHQSPAGLAMSPSR